MPHDFNVLTGFWLQELQEPSKKLSDTAREPAERDVEDDFDPEK